MPIPSSHPKPRVGSGQAGFSLVELLVSVVVGLAIVAALSLLFANNSRARLEMEKTSQQIENGRYTAMYLRDDLRLAGYWGEFNPAALSIPAVAPDPSATDDASVSAALPIAVQGYHFGMDSALYSTPPAGVSSLLTDLRAHSDVLVVRRASTCYAGPASAESSCSAMDTTAYKYFQTGLCTSQLSALASLAAKQFLISTSSAAFTTTNPNAEVTAPTYLAQKDCTTPAVTRAVYVRIYYVANNDVPGDGIPTLKMISLGANSFSAPVAIAEGIETLQVEYGRDTDGNGSPDTWTADAGTTGDAWHQVTAVKLHVIARNTQSTLNYTDPDRTYVLGTTATTDSTFGPYSDGYKRHAYTTVVRLNNAAGRLE